MVDGGSVNEPLFDGKDRKAVRRRKERSD